MWWDLLADFIGGLFDGWEWRGRRKHRHRKARR